MITYRTRLFDMRLDDLWDPDQRWALLSDTASKHSRTDPVVFLYQNYFRPARLLAIHVDESARVQQQEVQEYRCRGRDKPSDVVTCERTDVELALCLSATFVLCDGFRKLGLQNTEIDAMIRRDFSRLKKVWERRSQFVPLEVLTTTGVWACPTDSTSGSGRSCGPSTGISNAILKPSRQKTPSKTAASCNLGAKGFSKARTRPRCETRIDYRALGPPGECSGRPSSKSAGKRKARSRAP
jgi:hypothetical protein